MHSQRSSRIPSHWQHLPAVLAFAGGLLLSVVCATQATPPAAPTPSGRLLWWAQDLVDHLPLPQTSYNHDPSSVTWAGVEGARTYSSHTDCSGFLIALLERIAYPPSMHFLTWLGAQRPQAEDFYDAVVTQKSFIQIDDIAAVQPGDIIAISYAPDDTKQDTGHIMLIADLPSPQPASPPLLSGTVQWRVSVLDSSKRGHGRRDTRYMGEDASGKSRYQPGAGEGRIRLYTDVQGAILGYTWTTSSAADYYDQAFHPLAIGRLQ